MHWLDSADAAWQALADTSLLTWLSTHVPAQARKGGGLMRNPGSAKSCYVRCWFTLC